MSWERVDELEDEQTAELSQIEHHRDKLLQELADLQSKIIRKRKVLEQTQERARKQMKCLVRAMEEDGDDMTRTVIDASQLELDLFGAPDSSNPQILSPVQGS